MWNCRVCSNNTLDEHGEVRDVALKIIGVCRTLRREASGYFHVRLNAIVGNVLTVRGALKTVVAFECLEALQL